VILSFLSFSFGARTKTFAQLGSMSGGGVPQASSPTAFTQFDYLFGGSYTSRGSQYFYNEGDAGQGTTAQPHIRAIDNDRKRVYLDYSSGGEQRTYDNGTYLTFSNASNSLCFFSTYNYTSLLDWYGYARRTSSYTLAENSGPDTDGDASHRQINQYTGLVRDISSCNTYVSVTFDQYANDGFIKNWGFAGIYPFITTDGVARTTWYRFDYERSGKSPIDPTADYWQIPAKCLSGPLAVPLCPLLFPPPLGGCVLIKKYNPFDEPPYNTNFTG